MNITSISNKSLSAAPPLALRRPSPYNHLLGKIKFLGEGKFLAYSYLVGNSLFGRIDWIRKTGPSEAKIDQTYQGSLNPEHQPHGAGSLRSGDGTLIAEGWWELGILRANQEKLTRKRDRDSGSELQMQSCGEAVKRAASEYKYLSKTNKEIVNDGYGSKIKQKEILDCSGHRYIGNLINGLPSGQGEAIFLKGNRYVGNWINGRQSGYGEMFFSTGEKYEGHWKDNKQSGYGKMIFSVDKTYEGHWEDGKISGHGQMTYSPDRKYVGNWANNMKNGLGEMIFSNDSRYEGNWVNNKRNGHGKMIFPNGDTYIGSWKDDQQDGYGKMLYCNGATYEGNWVGNNQHGEGKMILSHGLILEGTWDDDRLIMRKYA